jgi:serine/threonine protein kinase
VESAPPGEEGLEGLQIKVADFGLSKDKDLTDTKHTVKMTGCGSSLWMAPEILLGEAYNEAVDVYSFAMCMLEVVDGHVPWHGIAGAGVSSGGCLPC